MSPNQKTILVVDDERDLAFILSKFLSDEGYLVHIVCDGDAAAAEAAKVIPDLIVLDVKMPGKDGYQVKAELNQNPVTANIPVIFVSANVSTLDKIKGLRLRADDYMTKPFEILELLARIDAALDRRKYYEEISMRDELTGLPNAHFFKKELAIAFSMAKRYGRIFTVGFIDVDRFKEINDTFGHQTGDRVLREVAKRMGLALRNPDILTRYGGDEFCVIIREATGEKAQVALNRFKNGVEENLFQGLNGDGKFPVSVSIGMVTYSDSFSSVEELMAMADANMYRNKNGNARAPFPSTEYGVNTP
ncbi:MAG TPA: diguanylate cyclase [bacterium]|nr:diguanylate cyclase [bacterium]